MTQAGPVPPEEDVTLSELLLRLARHGPEPMSIDELVGHFGARAFGAALFIFAVPNLLPLPPGSSTVLGLPLLLIAPQLAFGGRDPWIPRRVGQRTVDPKLFTVLSQRLSPWVRRIEGVTTRRMSFVFGGVGDLLLGAVCTLLAAVLILPIPLGNMLPAATIVVLALSLIQRDGLLALAGYGMAAVSAGLLILSGHVVVGAVDRLGSWLEVW